MPATNKQQVLRKLGLPANTTLNIDEIAEILELPRAALQEVYNRGIGAWKGSAVGIRRISDGKKDYSTSRVGKLGKEAWAMARVYSFINKSTTFKTTDSDIAREYNIG
jgi:hypothetical protein